MNHNNHNKEDQKLLDIPGITEGDFNHIILFNQNKLNIHTMSREVKRVHKVYDRIVQSLIPASTTKRVRNLEESLKDRRQESIEVILTSLESDIAQFRNMAIKCMDDNVLDMTSNLVILLRAVLANTTLVVDHDYDVTLSNQIRSLSDASWVNLLITFINLILFTTIGILDNITVIDVRSISQSAVGFVLSIIQIIYDKRAKDRQRELLRLSRRTHYQGRLMKLINELNSDDADSVDPTRRVHQSNSNELQHLKVDLSKIVQPVSAPPSTRENDSNLHHIHSPKKSTAQSDTDINSPLNLNYRSD